MSTLRDAFGPKDVVVPLLDVADRPIGGYLLTAAHRAPLAFKQGTRGAAQFESPHMQAAIALVARDEYAAPARYFTIALTSRVAPYRLVSLAFRRPP